MQYSKNTISIKRWSPLKYKASSRMHFTANHQYADRYEILTIDRHDPQVPKISQ